MSRRNASKTGDKAMSTHASPQLPIVATANSDVAIPRSDGSLLGRRWSAICASYQGPPEPGALRNPRPARLSDRQKGRNPVTLSKKLWMNPWNQSLLAKLMSAPATPQEPMVPTAYSEVTIPRS
jgi:hypothetical protein